MSERIAGRPADRALRPVLRREDDVTFRAMLGLFALILTCLLLILGIAYWIFPGVVSDERFTRPFPAYPAPVLQPRPRLDMDVFRAEEMKRLDGAGWQDRAAGRVHIPIAQAMRAVAAEGIPGWPTAPARPTDERDRR